MVRNRLNQVIGITCIVVAKVHGIRTPTIKFVHLKHSFPHRVFSVE